jgi:hypothetical protein
MYKVRECIGLYRGHGGALSTIPDGEERRAIIHSAELFNKIVNKYFISEQYLRFDPSVENMRMSQTTVQKATGQMKKMKEAMENEIHQFLETGEITLGFKDMELYERVKMLEDQEKEQTAIIVGLDDKVTNLENELTKHRDQILSIQHLLEVMIDKKNEELREAQETRESQKAKENEEIQRVEEYNKKMVEIYDCFLYIFVPVIVVVITVALYSDFRYSVYIPENRTLIMGRPSPKI